MTILLSRMTMKDPDLNPDATPRLSKRTGLGTEHDSIDGSLDSWCTMTVNQATQCHFRLGTITSMRVVPLFVRIIWLCHISSLTNRPEPLSQQLTSRYIIQIRLPVTESANNWMLRLGGRQLSQMFTLCNLNACNVFAKNLQHRGYSANWPGTRLEIERTYIPLFNWLSAYTSSQSFCFSFQRQQR